MFKKYDWIMKVKTKSISSTLQYSISLLKYIYAYCSFTFFLADLTYVFSIIKKEARQDKKGDMEIPAQFLFGG